MEKETLENLYLKEYKSVNEISKILNRSETTVNYWMKKYSIKKRKISDAIYLKNNPCGDPFEIILPRNLYEAELKGFGLGLYWGEGNKKNKNSIKLGNTDPKLIQKFMEFLIRILGVKKEKIKFSLQIFSDIDPNEAKKYWLNFLQVDENQFSKKITVTSTGKIGNYKQKNRFGVLTIYYHNTKLRNVLLNMLPL